jgi:RecG-like helicase
LRGPGDFLGQQQSGLPPFRFVELATDLKLAERARAVAAALDSREIAFERTAPPRCGDSSLAV